MEATDWQGARGGGFEAHQNPAVAQVRMGVKDVPAEMEPSSRHELVIVTSVPRDRQRKRLLHVCCSAES